MLSHEKDMTTRFIIVTVEVTKASPINEIAECDYVFDTFTCVLIIIILCVWIIYLCIR